MNSTPTLLNRILIAVLGLMLLAVGVLLMLLAAVPAVASWWHSWSADVWSGVNRAFNATRFPGRTESWLWILVALALVVLIALMVAWVAQQGKGRANLLAMEYDPGDVPGDVRIGGGVAEQALKHALANRPDLAGATITTYDVKGMPALKVRLLPRQGVAPHLLADEVYGLVSALEAVVGKNIPVLIHIGAGARTRFSRAERVR
ncbi:Asp23/Gls24 family envelope stress response protein [Arthrobacter sp. D3-16]